MWKYIFLCPYLVRKLGERETKYANIKTIFTRCQHTYKMGFPRAIFKRVIREITKSIDWQPKKLFI